MLSVAAATAAAAVACQAGSAELWRLRRRDGGPFGGRQVQSLLLHGAVGGDSFHLKTIGGDSSHLKPITIGASNVQNGGAVGDGGPFGGWSR